MTMSNNSRKPVSCRMLFGAATFLLGCAFFLPSAFAAAKDKEPQGKVQVFKKTPQGDLSIELFYPPGWKASDKRPAIVFFFGGGWANGSRSQFYPQCQYLASRGMVAATADYRISSKHKTTADKCVEDGKSAVRWMRAHAAELGIDPNRLAAGGGSAGGHVAACTGTLPAFDAPEEDAKISSKPNAMVLFNPVMTFPSQYGQRLPGDNDEARAKIAKEISPTTFVNKDTPPAIMFFGSDDRLVEFTRDYLSLSSKAGNRAELFVAAGQKHGFFNRPPYTDSTLVEADKFLASLKWLEGEPTAKVQAGSEMKKE